MTSEHAASRLFLVACSLVCLHFLISRMGAIPLSQIDHMARTNNGSESMNYPQGEAVVLRALVVLSAGLS